MAKSKKPFIETKLEKAVREADAARKSLKVSKERRARRKEQDAMDYQVEQAANRQGGVLGRLNMVPTAARRGQTRLAQALDSGRVKRGNSKAEAQIRAADREVTDNLGSRGNETARYKKGGMAKKRYMDGGCVMSNRGVRNTNMS